MVNVYLLDVTAITERDVSEYTHVLDEDRQTRITQYGRSADKRRSFGAGAALLYAWRMQYGDRAMPQTARGGNGKPYFIGETVSFCLSHSGDYAACVLAEEPDQEIGLDIQEPRPVRASMAARFFSEREQEQLRAGSDPCLIWSRKESLVKYVGSGLRGDLRLLDTAEDTFCGQFPQTKEDAPCGQPHQTAYIWSCSTADGYAVSVCAEKKTAYSLVYLSWEQVKALLEESSAGSKDACRIGEAECGINGR